MLAPPLAALAGTGWVELFQQYRSRQGWKRWLLPAGLLATTVFQLYVLHPYRDQIGPGWLMGLGAAGIGLSLVLFLAAGRGRPASAAALAAMLVLLAAPLYWAATPILYGDNSMLPQAGPAMQAMGGQGPSGQASPGQAQGMGRGANGGINTRLLAYVTGNNTGQKYLFAATDTNTAAPYIIETGKAVMAMGGFSGADPILTVEKLKQMVADNEVKYFLIPAGSGLGGGGGRGDSAVLEWIRANSTEVPGDQWQSDAGQGSATGPGGNKLYQINQSNSKDEM
jgi:4-amino-4-deoxy-L-arabinose transferase-like glycosyltransferase